jgi:hypothetical protein
MYAKIVKGEIVEYPIADIRAVFPNVSFPETVRDSDLPPGYVCVHQTVHPVVDGGKEKAVPAKPVFDGNRWVQGWSVKPLSAYETSQRLAAVKSAITQRVQQRLDAFAAERGYDSIMSAITYATSTVPRFAAEGRRCVLARDTTWAKLVEIFADAQAGRRPVPMRYEDIADELPALEWPSQE